jgi:MoaA/NifB/PqqE/SkfB family radical SAM enzyme
VHWECWSECNLQCAFCYRTRGIPLSTEDACHFIQCVKTGGASQIVFAGGDPSIRPDIVDLITFAKDLDLSVEIQTNGHHMREEFLDALKQVDLVGVSLDGEDAETHDYIRKKLGNFSRVISLLDFLDENEIPVIVRTLVCNLNKDKIANLGDILVRYKNIRRWSLLEFSAVGEGYANRKMYHIDSQTYNHVASTIDARFGKDMSLDFFSGEKKIGTYMLVTPDGRVYGTGNELVNGYHKIVGNITMDHLGEISEKLPFNAQRHQSRYGNFSQQVE